MEFCFENVEKIHSTRMKYFFTSLCVKIILHVRKKRPLAEKSDVCQKSLTLVGNVHSVCRKNPPSVSDSPIRKICYITVVVLRLSLPKGAIRNLSPHLRNSAILRTTILIAELRTKKSCGTAIADLQNLTSAIPQLSLVSCQSAIFSSISSAQDGFKNQPKIFLVFRITVEAAESR
jgi:hypothetical protein